MLDIDNRKKTLIDPFENKYEQVVNLVNQLNHQIELDLMDDGRKNQDTKIMCDFTKPSEFLFKHGTIDYFGYRETVYESILLLKGLKESIGFVDKFVLEGSLPKEIINKYIVSCYTGYFDTDCFNESHDHYIDFLKFIDQYPTICVSVDKMENHIIKYTKTQNSGQDLEYLKIICNKYRMKRLYVALHNKNYSMQVKNIQCI